MSRKVMISVWSDYVCPFCYLEEPILDRIQADFGPEVEVEWRAFELRPAPVPTLDPDGEYLHSTWERSVYPMAAERGMNPRLPPVQPRSRKAFEAERFARDHGRGARMHHALFQAFFERGLDIGDIEVLADIGRAVGLNASRLRAALESGDYTDAVLRDQLEAQKLGITGVPAMLVRADGDARLLTGAQPHEVVSEIVDRLREGRPERRASF